jgi:alpha-tubulin suppressor-like RCC1 family protein
MIRSTMPTAFTSPAIAACTYSYAIFAIDTAGNHDGPATATIPMPADHSGLTGRVLIGADRTDMTLSAGVASGVEAISAGQDHALAVKDGAVIAWGSDYNATRVPSSARKDIVAVSAGTHEAQALTKDGGVIRWGFRCSIYCTTPEAIASGVTAIATGGDWAYQLKDGRVYGTGIGTKGQPRLSSLTGVTAIAAGPDHALAVKNGTVIAWGDTGPVPESLRLHNDIVEVAAGIEHSLALTREGTVIA